MWVVVGRAKGLTLESYGSLTRGPALTGLEPGTL